MSKKMYVRNGRFATFRIFANYGRFWSPVTAIYEESLYINRFNYRSTFIEIDNSPNSTRNCKTGQLCKPKT